MRGALGWHELGKKMNKKQHETVEQLRKAAKELGIAAPLSVSESYAGVDVDTDVPLGVGHHVQVHIHIDDEGEVT